MIVPATTARAIIGQHYQNPLLLLQWSFHKSYSSIPLSPTALPIQTIMTIMGTMSSIILSNMFFSTAIPLMRIAPVKVFPYDVAFVATSMYEHTGSRDKALLIV